MDASVPEPDVESALSRGTKNQVDDTKSLFDACVDSPDIRRFPSFVLRLRHGDCPPTQIRLRGDSERAAPHRQGAIRTEDLSGQRSSAGRAEDGVVLRPWTAPVTHRPVSGAH